jgi:hypothetical protein
MTQRGRATAQKRISNGLKNPTEKILSAGFFYPLEKSLFFCNESTLKRLRLMTPKANDVSHRFEAKLRWTFTLTDKPANRPTT